MDALTTVQLRTDILVYNRYDQPILAVETKAGLHSTEEDAIFIRDYLSEYNFLQGVKFFMLTYLNRFYLWVEREGKFSTQPDYIIDADPILRPYFERTRIDPARIDGASFELLISTWLRTITLQTEMPVSVPEKEKWLLESGLYDAILDGRVRLQVKV